MKPSKARAKAVIYQIVQMSDGDRIETKIRLFKAFYFAHLYYAKVTGKYLSDWPIVHMPHGPGIHEFDCLLSELICDGHIRTREITVGPYPSTLFIAARTPPNKLDDAASEAIRDAVTFVSNKTGAQLTDITHEFSRSWLNASQGDILDIYSDLLDDEQYNQRKKQSVEVARRNLPELAPERIAESIRQAELGHVTAFEDVWPAA